MKSHQQTGVLRVIDRKPGGLYEIKSLSSLERKRQVQVVGLVPIAVINKSNSDLIE